jgi:hypothetical protein
MIDEENYYTMAHVLSILTDELLLVDFVPVEDKTAYSDYDGVKPKSIIPINTILEASATFVFETLEDLKNWESYLNGIDNVSGATPKKEAKVLNFKVIENE